MQRKFEICVRNRKHKKPTFKAVELEQIKGIFNSKEEADVKLGEFLSSNKIPEYLIYKVRKYQDPNYIEREMAGFESGSYEKTPFHNRRWYSPMHTRHFARLSKKYRGKIIYYTNTLKAKQNDKQTGSFDDFLIQCGFYDIYNNQDLRSREFLNFQKHFGLTFKLKFTDEPDKIREIYHNCSPACM